MPEGAVSTSLSREWLVAGLFALAFFIFSALCYWIVQSNTNDVNRFSSQHLPRYEALLSIQSSISTIETQIVDTSISASEVSVGVKQSLLNFEKALTQLKSFSEDAVNDLTVLETTFANVESIIETQVLVELFNSRARLAAEESSKHFSWAGYLVMVLGAFNFIVLFVLFRMNYARREAQHAQSRLVSHVRNNPNPVFALSMEGEVIYQNQAAFDVCERWDLETPLPENLQAILFDVDRSLSHEYYKGGRYFELNIAYLDGFSEFHAFLTDVTESRKAEEDLEYLAYHDPVTGLVNRQQFSEFVDDALSQEDDVKLTVAIMDLDLFEKVVVTAGMSIADKIARVAAIRFQRVVTKEQYFNSNSLSYIGGGLFCFAYPSDPIDASILIKRMQDEASAPFELEGFEFYLRLSVGMVSGKHLKNGTAEDALRLADAALNLSKKRGRDRVEYESWIAERHNRRVEIEFGLRTAIQREEFSVFYQPKVSLQTGRICGAEALLRWESEEGYISPAEFIPIAEETGQIMEVGQWVIEQACKDAAIWNRDSTFQFEPIPVAINVSAVQLLHADVAGIIREATEKADIHLGLVEAEVTETAVIEDFSRALVKLQELHDMGVAIALDDFGTGYSSLNYLQRLPVDILKIDRGFVQQLRIEALKNESLVESIVSMAHQLDLKVVAEGVEVEAQAEQLLNWGCEYAQGYLIAKPMSLADFLVFKKEFAPLQVAAK